MSPLDAEFVEHSADVIGEIPEGIVSVDTLGGAAVAGHVGHEDAEVFRQGVDVAGIIRHARRAGPAAVQEHHRRTGAGLGDEDVLAVHADGAFGHGVGSHCCSSMP